MTDRIEDLDEQIEVVAGRKAPLTTVPDWVTLYPGSDKSPMYKGKILSPQAKAVYNVLAMHVNIDRGDGTCWPSRKTIAHILGFSREQSVDQYLDQLDAADAIDRQPITRPNGALGVRYIVHQTPPPGYDGEQNVGELYARLRAEQGRERTRLPGRPRKTAAPAADPATPEPTAEETAEQAPAAKKAPAKKAPAKKATTAKEAPAKKAPAKKAAAAKPPEREKTPEEIALDEKAHGGAEKWWQRAAEGVDQKVMRPLMGTAKQKSGYFLNLRTRIREALEAGYTEQQIWDALHEIREWSPAKREFDRALGRAAGIQTPSRPGARTPLFRNQQWQEGEPSQDASAPAAAPDLSAFGVEVQTV